MWRIPKRDYENNSFSADKGNNKDNKLTHLGPMFPSYRNKPIFLHCKWTGWFLYDQSRGLDWVNKLDVFKVSNKNRRECPYEKCPYLEFFWCVFSRLWIEYGDHSIQFKYWAVKIRSWKIPNMDIFHAVGVSESKGSEVLYDCKGIKCKFS